MKRTLKYILCSLTFIIYFIGMPSSAAKSPKSKFYDFSEQLIDGEVKKPTTLYLNSREAVKFDRLMKLKKSFLPKLFRTAKERVFK